MVAEEVPSLDTVERRECRRGDLGQSRVEVVPLVGTEVVGPPITADSITVLDKKAQVLKILTNKDYSSLVGIGAAVTVWYTTEDGANHLEDIVYPQSAAFVPINRIGENIKRVIILPGSEESRTRQAPNRCHLELPCDQCRMVRGSFRSGGGVGQAA